MGKGLFLWLVLLATTLAQAQRQSLNEKLFDAIRKNDVKAAAKFLGAGASPHATEANDWPAIVVAASQSLAMVKLLVSKGAKIDARQKDQGWTALTQAITSHKADVAEYLLSKGADPMLPLNDNATPLHMAVRFNVPIVVSALLKRKVDVNARTTEDPSAVHNEETDRSDAQNLEPGFRWAGRTPLFDAISNPNLIHVLVAAGADLKVRDENGWTPLHEAAKSGSLPAVKGFLNLGMDSNAVSNQGFTPVHMAIRAGYGIPSIDVLKALIQAGADLKIKNRLGQTPADLLRYDALRIFASTNLSPSASEKSLSLRQVRAIFNQALQVLEPGAARISFPVAPVLDGWSIYPSFEFSGFGEKSGGKIDRKVRFHEGRSELALLYTPGTDDPPSIRLQDVQLNAYEALGKFPMVLKAGQPLIIPYPAKAAAEGGAVHLSYSWGSDNASGSGSFGEPMGLPNPGFVHTPVGKSEQISVYCSEIHRPLEFRVDKLSFGGKELTKYRGKMLILEPATDVDQFGMPKGNPLITVKRMASELPKIVLKYSYRLKGNKKWKSAHIEL